MVGLARRRDLRVVEPLFTELKAARAGRSGDLYLEAAAEIGDARLYQVLVRLREAWQGDKDWMYDMIEEAIEKCQPRA